MFETGSLPEAYGLEGWAATGGVGGSSMCDAYGMEDWSTLMSVSRPSTVRTLPEKKFHDSVVGDYYSAVWVTDSSLSTAGIRTRPRKSPPVHIVRGSVPQAQTRGAALPYLVPNTGAIETGTMSGSSIVSTANGTALQVNVVGNYKIEFIFAGNVKVANTTGSASAANVRFAVLRNSAPLSTADITSYITLQPNGDESNPMNLGTFGGSVIIAEPLAAGTILNFGYGASLLGGTGAGTIDITYCSMYVTRLL